MADAFYRKFRPKAYNDVKVFYLHAHGQPGARPQPCPCWRPTTPSNGAWPTAYSCR
jgi:hypothetical protein